MVLEIIALALFALLILVIGCAAWGAHSYHKVSCREGGGVHQWSMPAFRLRVCDHCGLREFFMRRWEFDGYDKKV